MKLCFATNNLHKLEEVKAILPHSIQLLSLNEIGSYTELPETSGTIAGNSLQKAQFVFQNYNLNCFADDSGLEVEALNGLPGVDSAIYAGPQRNPADNVKFLLKNIEGAIDRKARFITVITFILNGTIHQFEGVLNGTIALDIRGNNGFGYDPVFIPEEFSKTLAEMTFEEKNKISHRARAIEKLVKFINSNPEFS